MPENEDYVCPFCSQTLPKESFVYEGQFWSVRLNLDQSLLGRAFLVLNRHETDVIRLTEDDQKEFWELLKRVNEAQRELFQPDHFNFFFLMNVDPHVHFHCWPRYKNERTFNERVYKDDFFGKAYGGKEYRAPLETLGLMALKLREQLG